MAVTEQVHVWIDLLRIQQNVSDLARRTGVPIWAVVKADAYGLGVAPIVRALAERVAGFCTFSLQEAIELRKETGAGRPVIVLGPPRENAPAQRYRELNARPAVSTVEQATRLRAADPILCVDTGMQRFTCPGEHVERAIEVGGCREAFTHASRVEQAVLLREMLGGRGIVLHAAASGLIDEPAARLDLVRPGLALYAAAVRVTAPLVEVHDSKGPAGYTRFVAPRHGVILAGYAHGLRPGPCVMNGERRRILEVGMQSAFVEIDAAARVGDPVVLLGDGLAEEGIAAKWRCTPHEVLMRLAGAGERKYQGDETGAI